MEVRQRVEQLLRKLTSSVPPPEVLRGIRAVEVVEEIATPEARQLLDALAQGVPEGRLTREAKLALQRLGQQRRAR